MGILPHGPSGARLATGAARNDADCPRHEIAKATRDSA
jgi:hypothetical protein